MARKSPNPKKKAVVRAGGEELIVSQETVKAIIANGVASLQNARRAIAMLYTVQKTRIALKVLKDSENAEHDTLSVDDYKDETLERICRFDEDISDIRDEMKNLNEWMVDT